MAEFDAMKVVAGSMPEFVGQATNLTAARAILDRARTAGFIRVWCDEVQGHLIVRERGADGRWTWLSPYSGEREHKDF